MSEAPMDFAKLMQIQEPLDPELAQHLFPGGPLGGMMLKHPLVFDIHYIEQMNAVLNRQLRTKKECIEKAAALKQWASIMWLYERPYRFRAFMDYSGHMSNEEYWSILASIWMDTENLWQYKSIIPYLLTERRGVRQMMDERSRLLFQSLPRQVAVYRGYQRRNRVGYAWSLSPAKALWFARRFSPPKYNVVRGLVQKKDIAAVLAGRGELEVIAWPEYVKRQKIIRPLERPGGLGALLRQATASFTLPLHRSVHGPEHWERVEKNAMALCASNRDADLEVCRLFAICHDCQRHTEDEDPEHGRRAAEWINERLDLIPVRGDRLGRLLYACRYHNDGTTCDNDATIGTCWDADRLDLPRVGITPDPNLLSTETARNLMWRI